MVWCTTIATQTCTRACTLNHSKAPGEDPATGFSCDLKCEILIGTQAGFGREFYSSSLHRTELCGISPNATSERNSSQTLPHVHDYPGKKRPLNRHNLLPVIPFYLLIITLSCLSLWLLCPIMSSLSPEQSSAAKLREHNPSPTLTPKLLSTTESGPSTPSLISLQNAPAVQLNS